MKSVLLKYDVINKTRNIKQDNESIREYYERINDFFIVELDYRNRTKDVTLSEEELIWLTFVIEKWIREIKSTRLFDYLVNKSVKNLFDAYIIAERKMLKKKRELRQKKERKLQKKYQVTLQQLQKFVDRDLVDDVARTQKSHESSSAFEQIRSEVSKINAAVNITNIEIFAKFIASEFVKWIIASTSSQSSSFEISIVNESSLILKKMSCDLSEISANIVNNNDIETIDEILAFESDKWIVVAAKKKIFDFINTFANLSKSSFASHVETIDEILASEFDKWIVVVAKKKIIDYTSTFDEVAKNSFAFDIEVSNNSFDWSRCCTVNLKIVDMKILNQKIFDCVVTLDEVSKNSLVSFVENMKISIAMNMSSSKHLMNINDFAIETFDFDITLNAHSKNSSTQHIENSKTLKKNSVYIYELSALLIFDLSIDIDFEVYTADSIISKITYSIIEISVMFSRRKMQLSSFRDLALRHNLFDWNRFCINFIDRRIISIFICIFVSIVTFIISNVTFDFIEIAKIVDTVNIKFCEKEQLFCFTIDFSVFDCIERITVSTTNFYEKKQSFCFNVDVVCTFLVVVNIHATLTLTVDMIMKKSIRISLLNSIEYLISKSKHKKLSKIKIK